MSEFNAFNFLKLTYSQNIFTHKVTFREWDLNPIYEQLSFTLEVQLEP